MWAEDRPGTGSTRSPPLSGNGSSILPDAQAQTLGSRDSCLSPRPIIGQEVLSAQPLKYVQNPTWFPSAAFKPGFKAPPAGHAAPHSPSSTRSPRDPVRSRWILSQILSLCSKPSMAPVSGPKPVSMRATLRSLPHLPHCLSHLYHSLSLARLAPATLASCYSSDTPGMI